MVFGVGLAMLGAIGHGKLIAKEVARPVQVTERGVRGVRSWQRFSQVRFRLSASPFAVLRKFMHAISVSRQNIAR